jgi:hypothetical protein
MCDIFVYVNLFYNLLIQHDMAGIGLLIDGAWTNYALWQFHSLR